MLSVFYIRHLFHLLSLTSPGDKICKAVTLVFEAATEVSGTVTEGATAATNAVIDGATLAQKAVIEAPTVAKETAIEAVAVVTETAVGAVSLAADTAVGAATSVKDTAVGAVITRVNETTDRAIDAKDYTISIVHEATRPVSRHTSPIFSRSY